MRAVVYDKPESFSVTEIPDPHAGPGEVRIKVLQAGVCGTDLHLHHGEFGPTYPLTPGHELVGVVDEIGADVDVEVDVDLVVGQQVVADTLVACGGCAACRVGRTTFCVRATAMGVTSPGVFAEYVVVPAYQVFAADDLEPDTAVLAEPLACVVHGVDMLDMAPGSDVLVFGAGPTGLLLAQMLGGAADRVTVAASTQFKLDVAARHGADQTVLMQRNDPVATTHRLRALAPDGFDVVVDATGALAVLEQTVPLTKDGGTVFVYGMAGEADRWAVSPYEVFRRELTIKGSFAQHHSFSRSVAALRSGRVSAEGIITHRFALEDYDQVLAAIPDSSVLKAVVVP